METIKINIQETVEVQLPVYRKDNYHAYLVYSKDECLEICHSKYTGNRIGVCHSGLAWNSESTQDCSKEEFETIYAKTLQKINEIALAV